MGNGATFDPETWVEQHGDSLYRFAIQRVRDPEAAADLVQETFLGAIRARDTFSGGSSVRTWLVAILRNKIADRLRRLGREERFRGGDAPEGEGEGASMFDRRGRWRTPPLDWRGEP